ncbi:amino acid lyase [Clostridium sulfidigenes]|uniref:Amino acid lyase n=1 Tax=Clostridium sulfidigenes TaxID=318464 RepID=A0A084JBA6_9CLOT|nr:low specificity L-threonine aldolase [Clostridium sulfidigenes]KEZ86240.1 amino acid lyase [Clostridium sulfidigenes]HCO73381.1 low specificity L-threonine aldolase [Clostridium sp.]
MYSFKNDYSEGAHPRIIEALIKCNMEQSEGYGEDIFTARAIKLIKEKIRREDVDVHLLVGGTQTNLTALSAFLRPHEAVIAADTGHVLVHETGAIEATGHKVISVDVEDGKLTRKNIEAVIEEHTDEHMVKPKLVYISNSTEIGTIYKREEVEALSEVCKKHDLYLYVDGARLGSALCSNENNMKIYELAQLVDAFYIGGTKGGALIGEALVICRDTLKKDFRYHIKQKGALLAKGRILGIQFEELFKDNLYFDLATHANNMAQILKKGIVDAGYSFMINSSSNQVFPILPNKLINSLEKKYLFLIWEKIDKENSAIRLVTSWATNEEKVLEFIADVKLYN